MIIIAFGANLPSKCGPPDETFKQACQMLEKKKVIVLKASSLWQTSPVDVPDEQPWYTNSVLSVKTSLSAKLLLETLFEVENAFGRERPFPNASKTIDLDLIAYGEQVMNEENCVIPHPRMHKRAFVLKPLYEINSDWCHPVLKQSLDALIKDIPSDQVMRRIESSQVA